MLVALDLVSQCLFCSRRRPPITRVHCHTMEARSGGSHDKYLLTDLCDSFEGTLLPLSRSNVQTRLTVDTMCWTPLRLSPPTRHNVLASTSLRTWSGHITPGQRTRSVIPHQLLAPLFRPQKLWWHNLRLTHWGQPAQHHRV